MMTMTQKCYISEFIDSRMSYFEPLELKTWTFLMLNLFLSCFPVSWPLASTQETQCRNVDDFIFLNIVRKCKNNIFCFLIRKEGRDTVEHEKLFYPTFAGSFRWTLFRQLIINMLQSLKKKKKMLFPVCVTILFSDFSKLSRLHRNSNYNEPFAFSFEMCAV